MLICSCDEKFSGDDRANFTWRGKYDGRYGKRDVTCNATCSKCSVMVGFNWYELDDEDYEQVYEYCDGLTKYTSPSKIQVDTTKHDPIPIGKVTFDSSSLMKYGYDSWKTCTGVSKINYVSMAEGCSTHFRIIIDGNLATAYNRIVAITPRSYNVSFSKGTMKDTLALTTNINEVKIFALAGALKNTPIDIYVYGIEDPAKPACLAGDCYGAEDRLQVIVYSEIQMKRATVFKVASPTLNPTPEEFKAGADPILKQAVVEMGDSLDTCSLASDSWDLNGNGKVDYISNHRILQPYKFGDDGDTMFSELTAMEFSAQIEADRYDGANNRNRGVFLIGKYFRTHYLMTYSYRPDSKDDSQILHLHDLTGITTGETYRLARYNDSLSDLTGHYEDIVVTQIYEAGGYIKFRNADGSNTLSKAYERKNGYSLYLASYDDFEFLGITPQADTMSATPASCSFVAKGGLNYRIIVHEFLHQGLNGFFRHVTTGNIKNDEIVNPIAKNLMNCAPNGTELRKRSLTIPNWEPAGGAVYSQWDKFRE